MRKYDCNDEFFSQETERSFYWAGFIAADGCVRLKSSKYSTIKVLEITLSGKEKEFLQKFLNDINSNNPIHNTVSEGYSKAHIQISSAKIFDDLAKFGIRPNKTKDHNFPDWLVSHNLVRHFMRGYFDGDGGYYLNKIKVPHQMTVRVCGTLEFLQVYKNILESKSGFSSISKPYMYNGQGALNYFGNILCSKISSFLYDDSNVYLERKYNQAQQSKKMVKRKSRPNKEDIISAYKELGSTAKVGNRFGYCQQSISNIMTDYCLTYLYSEV
jgi:hypothetical protein